MQAFVKLFSFVVAFAFLSVIPEGNLLLTMPATNPSPQTA